MKRSIRLLLCLWAVGSVALLTVFSPPSNAEGSAPSFKVLGNEIGGPQPGGFVGPCGLAVDPDGTFYIADYYRSNVDVFDSATRYLTQATKVGQPSGPCGLAIGAGGDLYANVFHAGVVKVTPSEFPLTKATSFTTPMTISSNHSTGVAVDPTTGWVYVDERAHVAVYEASGAPVESEGVPLLIGVGSIADGYGVAVSSSGLVYVADASDNVIKVFDPSVDLTAPAMTIDGEETPPGRFVSLRDAALAINRATGQIYVADNLQPEEHTYPEAAIYAFDSAGRYSGKLTYNIVDALPPGLAVDSSNKSTRGRIYVTSGNTENAVVYAYLPGGLEQGPGLCAEESPCGGSKPSPLPEAGAAVGGPPTLPQTAAGTTSEAIAAPVPSAPPRAAPPHVAHRPPHRHHRRCIRSKHCRHQRAAKR